MKYLNVETSTVDSEAYQSASRAQQAVWMALLRYCAGQLNSGLIAGCLNWPDAKWQRVVRVGAREVNCECPLWNFEGHNLRVRFYPLEQQEQYKKICAGGSEGARRRWNDSPTGRGIGSGNAKGNGMKDKEKEFNVPPVLSSFAPADLGKMKDPDA